MYQTQMRLEFQDAMQPKNAATKAGVKDVLRSYISESIARQLDSHNHRHTNGMFKMLGKVPSSERPLGGSQLRECCKLSGRPHRLAAL